MLCQLSLRGPMAIVLLIAGAFFFATAAHAAPLEPAIQTRAASLSCNFGGNGLCTPYVASGAEVCVSYQFTCVSGDTACTPAEVAAGYIKASSTAVSAATYTQMQSAPSVYMGLTGCMSDNCNPCPTDRGAPGFSTGATTAAAPGLSCNIGMSGHCTPYVVSGAEVCVSYQFTCVSGDTACTPAEVAAGYVKASSTAVNAATYAQMQSAPSVYMNLTGCMSDNCNPCPTDRSAPGGSTGAAITAGSGMATTAAAPGLSCNVGTSGHCTRYVISGAEVCVSYQYQCFSGNTACTADEVASSYYRGIGGGIPAAQYSQIQGYAPMYLNVTGCTTANCNSCPADRGAPTCEVAAPSNGFTLPADGSTVSYNETVTYHCNAHYTLSGNGTRVCTAYGTLSGQTPTCQAAGTSSSVASGSATTTRSVMATTVMVLCLLLLQ